MRVRYLCSMGMSEGPGIQAGDILDVPDDEAERLIEKDLAVADDGSTPATDGEPQTPPEPYNGYDGAKVDEVVEKIESGELGVAELVNLRQAEDLGKGRSTVLTAIAERLDVAEAALKPSAVDVPDDVALGETPGWPADADGEPLDIPDQVREELATAAETITTKEAELTDALAKAETAESSKAAKAEKATPKKGKGTKASSKAATAAKRGS